VRRPTAVTVYRALGYGALCAEAGVVIWYALTHNPFDLNVYLWGGRAVTHDTRLYLVQVARHWFTYTPFAAILFAPLTVLPVVAARVLWELASIGAFAVGCVTALRLAGYHLSRSATVGVVAAGLALEPMYHTLYLGQVNLILLALVLIDVWRAARGRPAGVGVGIAAAVKLTPAIFVVLFLLTRRTRDALVAAGTFVLCGLIGYLVAPGASRLYWSSLFYDTKRVYAPYISNQSPYGAVIRILGGNTHVAAWYPVLPLVIGAVGLAAATVLARSDDWLGAAVLTGLTGLLVSPISWTHHWVWIMPALVLLVRAGHRVAAACGYLLFALAPLWWTPHFEAGFHGLQTVVANCYLIAGVAFLGYLAWHAYRTFRTGSHASVTASGEHSRPASAIAPSASARAPS
jgi:hypothetical protein